MPKTISFLGGRGGSVGGGAVAGRCEIMRVCARRKRACIKHIGTSISMPHLQLMSQLSLLVLGEEKVSWHCVGSLT